MLRLAAAVERVSEHPLALAIVAEAEERGVPLPSVADFDSPIGKGATGTVEGKRIMLGNAAFLTEAGVETASLAADAEVLRGDGATAIYVSVGGRIIATEGYGAAEVLRLAAAVERVSEHPLALAIVAEAEERGVP
ncbi:hypothetical protein CG422_26600, partial [Shigella flexneri]